MSLNPWISASEKDMLENVPDKRPRDMFGLERTALTIISIDLKFIFYILLVYGGGEVGTLYTICLQNEVYRGWARRAPFFQGPRGLEKSQKFIYKFLFCTSLKTVL